MIYALKGVKAHFDSVLDGILITIESEESISIPRWKVMEYTEILNRQTPAIEILPGKTIPDYSDEEGPLEEPWDYHYLEIYITMSGSDTKEIEENLLWYRESIRRAVKTDGTFGNRFNRVRLKEADYSPMVKNQKDGKIYQVLTQGIEVRVYR
ncbi:MAG: hypothetical protein JXB88_03330 [Spirochaetales bacterium]|nr:hypothetical protein [Spirochaetales bacterium]